MATRVPGLRYIAEVTGESVVTVENCGRVMSATQVPAPYNTRIGRGNRHAHLSVEWLCSTFLALVLADPKNAPARVPAIGNLRLGQTLAVNRQKDTAANALLAAAPKLDRTFTMDTSSPKEWLGKEWLGETVFDLLVNLTKDLAVNRDGPTHQELRKKFALTIGLGSRLSAELEVWDYDGNDGTEWSLCCSYDCPSDRRSPAPSTSTVPIARNAVIELRHIQMLASMFADTLKHMAAIEAPLVQPLALDTAADAEASPTNENGAPGRAPRTRNQDHNSNSIPEADTPEVRREREISQASSSCDLGRPHHSMRITTHGHPDSHPALAAVA